jgi:hypothetical protein
MHSFCSDQGDQIGQVFAYWAVVYFGGNLKFSKVAQIIGHLFTTVQVMN